MARFVFLLSPPRSFSTVVSNMLGQHPKMYSFPELHLFVGDTIAEVLAYHERMPLLHTDGLYRAIGELQFGGQTAAAIDQAKHWLSQRNDWSPRQLLDELAGKVLAEVVVEKSPVTAFKMTFLRRMASAYPDARFIHLVRHPVSSVMSMRKMYRDNDLFGRSIPMSTARAMMLWYQMHANIAEFTAALPQDRWLRLRGEDAMDEPRLHMQKVAEWLELDSDHAAVEAMLHPEHSPYAGFGPENARLGNDTVFFREPRLRPRAQQEKQLMSAHTLARFSASAPHLFSLAKTFGYA